MSDDNFFGMKDLMSKDSHETSESEGEMRDLVMLDYKANKLDLQEKVLMK